MINKYGKWLKQRTQVRPGLDAYTFVLPGFTNEKMMAMRAKARIRNNRVTEYDVDRGGMGTLSYLFSDKTEIVKDQELLKILYKLPIKQDFIKTIFIEEAMLASYK